MQDNQNSLKMSNYKRNEEREENKGKNISINVCNIIFFNKKKLKINLHS